MLLFNFTISVHSKAMLLTQPTSLPFDVQRQKKTDLSSSSSFHYKSSVHTHIYVCVGYVPNKTTKRHSRKCMCQQKKNQKKPKIKKNKIKKNACHQTLYGIIL